MLKRLLERLAAAGAAVRNTAGVAAAALLLLTAGALAVSMPSVPNNGPINPALINDLNLLLNQLNGFAGYTGTPQIMSLGAPCSNSGAVSTLTCTGQRGTLVYTSGITIAATGTTQTFTITDNLVTVASVCRAYWESAFTAGSAVTVATVTPTANTLTVVAVNAGTTANAVTAGTLAFACDN